MREESSENGKGVVPRSNMPIVIVVSKKKEKSDGSSIKNQNNGSSSRTISKFQISKFWK